MRLFKFIMQIWQKMTCWVVFWKCQMKQTVLKHAGFKKRALKEVGKTPPQLEACKLTKPPGEAKLPRKEESSKVAELCVLASPTDRTQMGLGHQGRSLLRVPRTAVRSASMIMFSALQSSWQMCRWKSSVSSASISSQVRTSSPLGTPEAELLREVYLVLWAIRKQLRQLAHRQERHRSHHVRAHSSALAEPVLALKQDARGPV
ncbi:sperm acrosome developmental regulator [Erethizon dorsatum]